MEGRDSRQQEEHQRRDPAFPQLLPETSSPQEHNQEQDDQLDISAVEQANTHHGEDDDDADFEFAFASHETDLPAISPADEIFSQGRIRPIYPVFDRGLFHYYHSQAAAEKHDSPAVQRLPLRDLMMMQRQQSAAASTSKDATASTGAPELTRTGSCSSSDDGDDDLEGVPAETYCLWTPGSVPPSPDNLGRKSRSTGSSCTKRWRLRDLVLGRSHSDGRQKLMFFQQQQDQVEPARSTRRDDFSEEGEKKGKKSIKDGEKNNKGKDSKDHQNKASSTIKKKSMATELDMATAHRLYYTKTNTQNLTSRTPSASESTQGQRRPSSSTFLPYRKDLFVGIFPHARSPGRGLGSSSFYGF